MKFQIRRSIIEDPDGQVWYYVLLGGNGQVMLTSEMMSSKQACLKSIHSIKTSIHAHTKVDGFHKTVKTKGR